MEILILLLILWCVVPIFICANVAESKNQSVALWVILSLMFGWFAVLILAIVPKENN